MTAIDKAQAQNQDIMYNILLIDDDEKIGKRLQAYFKQHGLQLGYANHPQLGLAQLAAETYDLVILDIMMPDIDGLELCKQIRQTSSSFQNIPILMLSARGEVMDRVVGIEIGADDYLAKPFEPRELVVRAQAIIKRSQTTPANKNKDQQGSTGTREFIDLQINYDLRQVSIQGQTVELTTNEYRLLELFSRNPGKNFTRDEILNFLKGTDAELLTRSVDILVSRLRNKLKPTAYIKTVWGSGYSFVPEQL